MKPAHLRACFLDTGLRDRPGETRTTRTRAGVWNGTPRWPTVSTSLTTEPLARNSLLKKPTDDSCAANSVAIGAGALVADEALRLARLADLACAISLEVVEDWPCPW